MDRHAIAGRLREILASLGDIDHENIARTLRVEELSLRMSIDDLSPHPTVEVLQAVVGHFGLDPSWLLTGEYDPARHRETLLGDAATIADAVRELADHHPTPTVMNPTISPPASPQPPSAPLS